MKTGNIHSGRKRILDAVNHHRVDRLPTDMWATVEIQERLFDHFGITDGKGGASPWIGLCGGPLSRSVEATLQLWEVLGVDGIFDVRPPYTGPKRPSENGIVVNEWGFGYEKKSYGEGEYDEQVIFPLQDARSIIDLDRFSWPDPDWYDYGQLPSIIEQCGGRAVSCGYSALFTYHNYLRGMEASLLDPLTDPELCREIIRRISLFFTEYHQRCYEAAGPLIDFTQVTDDWGSQNGLMTSPAVFEEFYQAATARAIDLAHRYNIFVFHHDDGDMRPLLGRMVELGIDVLNPIQWRCGNWDLEELKKNFGNEICFHSAVDNQETLPLGSPAQVREETEYLIQTLSSDATGFILGPCHNLQVNTPVENIVAMYETARFCGK